VSGDFPVQLAAGITSGNRACRTCRRGSSRGCRCRCRGMRALPYVLPSISLRCSIYSGDARIPPSSERDRNRKRNRQTDARVGSFTPDPVRPRHGTAPCDIASGTTSGDVQYRPCCTAPYRADAVPNPT